MMTQQPLSPMVKLLGLMLLVVAILAILAKVTILPLVYEQGEWWQSLREYDRRFQFCKYEIPQGYEFKLFRHGQGKHANDHCLVVWEKAGHNQSLLLLTLAEFPQVELGTIGTHLDQVKNTFQSQKQTFSISSFSIRYLLATPSLFQVIKIPQQPTPLTLHGIQQTETKEFETEETHGKLITGEFSQVAFVRPSTWSRRFAIPVIDFTLPGRGAIAIINEKAAGKTIFALMHNSVGKELDLAEFEHIVRSVSFKAQPYEAAFDKYLQQHPNKVKLQERRRYEVK